MMQKKSLGESKTSFVFLVETIKIVTMGTKKKKAATLDEILAKLNEAENEFKTIYSSVDFDSFRVQDTDNEQPERKGSDE